MDSFFLPNVQIMCHYVMSKVNAQSFFVHLCLDFEVTL